MYRQLNRKRYDTEKAVRIGAAVDNTLYRKKTGEFFLHVMEPAEDIKPLSYDDAKSWALQHLSPMEYSGAFLAGGYEKKLVSYTILPITYEKIKRAAAAAGIAAGDVIDRLAEEHL